MTNLILYTMISTQKAQIRDILEMIKEDFLQDDYIIYIYYWNSNILFCNIINLKINKISYIIIKKILIIKLIYYKKKKLIKLN